MKEALNGKWSYRSFRHAPIVVNNGQVDGTPELAVVWAPLGTLEAVTGEAGDVKGTLTFAPGVALKVTGTVHPGTGKDPASVELIGEGLTSVNRIKGFFIPESDHVVGTIMCVTNDLAKQANGTAGPFVLVPLKS